MNPSSWKLSYGITEIEFRPNVVASVKKAFGIEIGKGYLYRVLVSFKRRGGWTEAFPMIYDTGAVVSLLPSRFFEFLGVERFAPVKLTGISPEIEVPAKLARATMKFIDVVGKESPEVEGWVAIAERRDVPLIIGLKDLADTHQLTVDTKKKVFYLEFY